MSKHPIATSLVVAALLAVPAFVYAQPPGHYCPGSEGLLGSSLPPPGLYARDYNVFYTADRFDNSSGHSATPANYSVFTYAQVPRLVWIADASFLGANPGVSVLLPFVYEDVKSSTPRGLFDSSSFGMGDLALGGILTWHFSQFDIVAANDVWMPIGQSEPDSTDAGLGYWADMPTFGVTWYMDTNKTWSVSALSRYEFNSDQRNLHYTPGQVYTLEWGIGKKFDKIFQAGAVGYYQQKVTGDSGVNGSSALSYVAAVGPEIGAKIPQIETSVTLRYLNEFMAVNRAQGQTITLTLTRRF
jgi:hypothetical protein